MDCKAVDHYNIYQCPDNSKINILALFISLQEANFALNAKNTYLSTYPLKSRFNLNMELKRQSYMHGVNNGQQAISHGLSVALRKRLLHKSNADSKLPTWKQFNAPRPSKT